MSRHGPKRRRSSKEEPFVTLDVVVVKPLLGQSLPQSSSLNQLRQSPFLNLQLTSEKLHAPDSAVLYQEGLAAKIAETASHLLK